MQVIQWSQPERRIPPADAEAFFRRPLDRPVLFNFATSRLEMAPHAGAFSLKLVLKGRETYGFGRRQVTLAPGELMLVPEGCEYSSLITAPAESLSVFLPTAEAAGLWRQGTADHAVLLDDDGPALPSRPDPLPLARTAGPAARRLMGRLTAALRAQDVAGTEEAAKGLLVEAARRWRGLDLHAALPAVRRAAAREELIGRVLRARDMIEDLRGVDCRIEALAAAARLSPYHFLRTFKEVLGATPGGYARRVRLRHARELERLGLAAAQVARATGYGSSASLRRAVRRTEA